MSGENIWRLINELTMSVHKHDETHSVADYQEIATSKSALTKYIATLLARAEKAESMVERLIEAGEHLVYGARMDSAHSHIPTCDAADNWDELAAEWKEGKK